MAPITFDDILKLAVVIMAIWGFYKVIVEIVKAITERHDKEQKWDQMSAEKEEIVCRYNSQFTEIKTQIDDVKTDFEAKIQEIRAEQYILTDCMRAVLDGQHQQGCNGRVTEAINTLDNYLNERAHK